MCSQDFRDESDALGAIQECKYCGAKPGAPHACRILWASPRCQKCGVGNGHRDWCPNRVRGIAPTDAAARKALPVATGVLDYFPDALLAVAALSKAGNDQHNPGQPLHWDRTKSTDHADCIVRHLLDRGTLDTDKQRHSAKVAWRALALLQTEIEQEREAQKAAA